MRRTSGVLMHISSLFGDYSIGSFGNEAKEFIDFLADGGFTFWQVLPFCMTDESNSPYKSYSAFGGNPYFIDLPTLHRRGLLTDDELASAKQHFPYLCEYKRLSEDRIGLLRLAASRLSDKERDKVLDFAQAHPELDEAANFIALKESNCGKPWYEWTVFTPLCDELFFRRFCEYEFYNQWLDVKSYANSRGIEIIGDIPIYVAHDSADVYSNKEQFLLEENNMPSSVAGVPPDYFSEEGQLWGNPLYNWRKMRENGYTWWEKRLRHMLTLFDGVRIDHFRGLESFYSIPAAAKSAKEGKWVKGPGRAFIDKIRSIAGEKLIIAEDLGDITPSVEALVKYSGFPGMRVFQFGFLGDESSPHLPHNYVKNCVAYTGTHDNNTLLGYIWESDEGLRTRMLDYCGCEHTDWSRSCKMIIRTVMASHADTVIFPIQDIFVFGADTRMNTPGTDKNNWQYRITREQLYKTDRSKFRYYNDLYGRTPHLAVREPNFNSTI